VNAYFVKFRSNENSSDNSIRALQLASGADTEDIIPAQDNCYCFYTEEAPESLAPRFLRNLLGSIDVFSPIGENFTAWLSEENWDRLIVANRGHECLPEKYLLVSNKRLKAELKHLSMMGFGDSPISLKMKSDTVSFVQSPLYDQEIHCCLNERLPLSCAFALIGIGKHTFFNHPAFSKFRQQKRWGLRQPEALIARRELDEITAFQSFCN